MASDDSLLDQLKFDATSNREAGLFAGALLLCCAVIGVESTNAVTMSNAIRCELDFFMLICLGSRLAWVGVISVNELVTSRQTQVYRTFQRNITEGRGEARNRL